MELTPQYTTLYQVLYLLPPHEMMRMLRKFKYDPQLTSNN